MSDRLRAAAAGMLMAFLPAAAGAQPLLETYRAEIAPVDRRNSSGAVLTDLAAILAQDRANVHRFGELQSGDTVDVTFSSRDQRAEMGGLLARGSISPEAERALRGSGSALLEIGVWGNGGSATRVTVDVAQAGVPSDTDPKDPLLTQAEIRRDAPRIQASLNARGFDAGPVDGQPGQRTRDAIAAYQRSVGRPATGALTRSEWATLQAGTAASGPSFDCAGAATATERAICASPALAALDRALTEAWAARRKADGSDALLAEQRRWIVGRDACGGDVACLERSMRDRVASLGGTMPAQAPVTAEAGLDVAAADPVQAGSRAGGMQDTSGSMSVAAEDGLITVDGRVLYSIVDANALALPQGAVAIKEHEQELARRLAFTGWAIGADDLAASLAQAPDVGRLRNFFDALPRPAQDEIVRLGLSSSGVAETSEDRCFNNTRSSRLSCATQRLETVFDQRRFLQGAAKIVAREVEAAQLDLPLSVRVFCPLGAIDQAYDFETGTVNWASMIENGCRLNGPESDLAAAVPERTEMDAARVEELARRHLDLDAQGQPSFRPLMIAFDGEITVEREPDARIGPDGMVATTQTLRRTGPVDLRWSGSPDETILTFDAPTGNRPTEAVDLREAGPAFRLVEGAPEVDAARLGAALADPASLANGTVVRLPAWAFGDEGPTRLSIGNFFLPEEPAQRIAAQIGQPLEHVAWTQLITRERGVPDTELVLVFPAPYASLESEPIDPVLAERRNQEDVALIARISTPMRMQGAAGPALVAVVEPLAFEITEPGIGGARQVVARVGLAPMDTVAQEQVFLPSAWWFAAKGAELRGVELDTHLNAAMDRANLHSGDTFARLDALTEAKAAIAQAQAGGESDGIWVAGRITLGAYDLERQAWPVNGLGLVLPVRDPTEAAVARRVQPEIDTRSLFLPMSIDEARTFEAVREAARRRAGPLDFYARVDLLLPPAPDQLAVRAHVRELFLFPLEGSPSQPMRVSPAFDPDAAIARLEFGPAAASEAPAMARETQAAVPKSTSAALEPDPGDGPVPAEQTGAAEERTPAAPADDGWPDLPDVEIARSDWDLVGLQTGMTMAEAETVLVKRGGVLAAFERPRTQPDPASVRATLYQKMYVGADGTEAITLAAPGPDGPVLAILRRMQLSRGDLPFGTIRQSLIEKYDDPAMENEGPVGSRMYWFDGSPGTAQAICRAHFPRRVIVEDWRRDESIGGPLDLSPRPAAWDWAIADMPVDHVEQASPCGRVLTFEPEGAMQQGGAAFSMMLLDIEALRIVDEALAGVPAAEELEIDF